MLRVLGRECADKHTADPKTVCEREQAVRLLVQREEDETGLGVIVGVMVGLAVIFVGVCVCLAQRKRRAEAQRAYANLEARRAQDAGHGPGAIELRRL